jgi:SAM-dependent methyltransferase
MPPPPANHYRARGREPLERDEVLRRAEARLGAEDSAAFARRHGALVAYPTEHTARAFYDFAARHDLTGLLACHRFHRVIAIAESLRMFSPELPLDGAAILDVGAGGGFLAGWLRSAYDARVTVSDLSPATEDALAAQGFPLLRDAQAATRYDLVLCADSLGEIHADEDAWLADAAHADDPMFSAELEARYGLAQKLSALRPLLAPRASGTGGRVALFEPAPHAHFWRGAARLLEGEGWEAKVLGPDPTWGLILTPPPALRATPSPLHRASDCWRGAGVRINPHAGLTPARFVGPEPVPSPTNAPPSPSPSGEGEGGYVIIIGYSWG